MDFEPQADALPAESLHEVATLVHLTDLPDFTPTSMTTSFLAHDFPTATEMNVPRSYEFFTDTTAGFASTTFDISARQKNPRRTPSAIWELRLMPSA